MMAGGYVSVDTGSAVDGNTLPIPKTIADQAFDAAACIGCGACAAACKNAAAHLFVGAKITQLALLPQGHAERVRRVVAMVDQMEKEGFGACSNEGECEAVCPKEIKTTHISKLIREYQRALVKGE
jgi:succinate dehydrogenase / fumarate reductase iron-sulfur subunit